jgi:sulfur-carrier protein
MATIRIPPVLRTYVGGAKIVTAEGTTVGVALDDLFARSAGLREQILTGEGTLSTFINVYVDDQDVRYLQGLTTPLTASSVITLLPAMAGGR